MGLRPKIEAAQHRFSGNRVGWGDDCSQREAGGERQTWQDEMRGLTDCKGREDQGAHGKLRDDPEVRSEHSPVRHAGTHPAHQLNRKPDMSVSSTISP